MVLISMNSQVIWLRSDYLYNTLQIYVKYVYNQCQQRSMNSISDGMSNRSRVLNYDNKHTIYTNNVMARLLLE